VSDHGGSLQTSARTDAATAGLNNPPVPGDRVNAPALAGPACHRGSRRACATL